MKSAAAALATALAVPLLFAVPAEAATAQLRLTKTTVVVGERGTGTWTTLYATGLPSWVRIVDTYLTGPGGDRMLVDLAERTRDGLWEGDAIFSRFDRAGKWTARTVLMDGSGRRANGPTAAFHVKRRTQLTASRPSGRTSPLSGTLRKMLADGSYRAYAGQKIRLYRWSGGGWQRVATVTTSARGKYGFGPRAGRLQVRFSGTAVNASVSRTA